MQSLGILDPRAPLDILITNLYLASRSGTEVVVRDLALHLTKRGHRVTVFAPGGIGAIGEEVRACGVAIFDDVKSLPAVPDVIHGHHSVPTLLAMARFPNVPAVWMSHDFRYWFDEPPKLSHIHRYLPVDETRRKFLVNDRSIPADKVEILYNAVDLTRIPARAVPLQEKPESLLAFTKTNAQIEVLRSICKDLNIRFSALGRGVRREIANPERELVNHDIVVATGRSAIEAMCAGASVIVGDARGLGGLVTSENYEYFRRFNFGSDTFSRALTHDEIVKEIGMYDAGDARRIAEKIRDDANIEHLLDRLEVIYAETLARSAQSGAQTSSDISQLWNTQKHWPAGAEPEWSRHRKALRSMVKRNYYWQRMRGLFQKV